MGNQGNPCRPKTRVIFGARCLFAHLTFKLTFDNRDMYAAFFKESPAQHSARPTAQIIRRGIFDFALPVFKGEYARLAGIKLRRGFALKRFKFCANIIAQGFEPSGRFFFLRVKHERPLRQLAYLPQGFKASNRH